MDRTITESDLNVLMGSKCSLFGSYLQALKVTDVPARKVAIRNLLADLGAEPLEFASSQPWASRSEERWFGVVISGFVLALSTRQDGRPYYGGLWGKGNVVGEFEMHLNSDLAALSAANRLRVLKIEYGRFREVAQKHGSLWEGMFRAQADKRSYEHQQYSRKVGFERDVSSIITIFELCVVLGRPMSWRPGGTPDEVARSAVEWHFRLPTQVTKATIAGMVGCSEDNVRRVVRECAAFDRTDEYLASANSRGGIVVVPSKLFPEAIPELYAAYIAVMERHRPPNYVEPDGSETSTGANRSAREQLAREMLRELRPVLFKWLAGASQQRMREWKSASASHKKLRAKSSQEDIEDSF